MSHDEIPPTIAVVEEHLRVEKRNKLTGRVRVSTQTEVVENIVPVSLSRMDVDVVRVPVDLPIESVPAIVTEGDLTIIPVVEERLVVTRQLYLREEVHLRRIEHRDTSDLPVTIRRQTVAVERLEPEDQGKGVVPTREGDQHEL